MMEAIPIERERYLRRSGALAFCLLLFVAFCLLVVRSKSGPRTQGSTPGEAAWMATNFVKDRLKAPATANFPSTYSDDICIESLGQERYLVRGWVDSQNTFGANVRTRWVCVLRHAGGDRWRCESVAFDGS